MKKLKVWGGRFVRDGACIRRIVAAYTKKQAMELAEISYSEITNYWSETFNNVELAIAQEVGVWDKLKEWSDDPKYIVRVK